MEVLEKILEEIEEKAICGGYEEKGFVLMKHVREIIKNHMEDDDWIPCRERMPEEHDSMFAKFKGTDKWSNAMFEKKSDMVNVTVEFEDGTRKTDSSYTLDGKWKYEKEYKITNAKVIAWMPLQKPYKGV